MNQTNKRWLFVLTGVMATVGLAGAALATAGVGILSAPIIARGAFQDTVDLKFKVSDGSGTSEVIHVDDTRETVMQQIVVGPGGTTGWHSHPGPAIALIKSGTLTLYSGDDATCTGRTFEAGEAFVDSGQGHVHMARNLSQTQNLEVWVTYFDVPFGGSVRVDKPDPGNCPF